MATPRKRATRPTPLNRRAVAYMASNMAMAKTDQHQGENWLLGHMVTFSAGERANAIMKIRRRIDVCIAEIKKTNASVAMKDGATWALVILRKELTRVAR